MSWNTFEADNEMKRGVDGELSSCSSGKGGLREGSHFDGPSHAVCPQEMADKAWSHSMRKANCLVNLLQPTLVADDVFYDGMTQLNFPVMRSISVIKFHKCSTHTDLGDISALCLEIIDF